MSTEIQSQQREQTLSQYIAAALHAPTTRSQVATGFAPWLDIDQFAGQCAIVASDPAMHGCDRNSLLKALLKCGQYGLIPGPARHVSLIPDKTGQVQVRPEFRGWQFVWAVAGWEVNAHLVHRSDVLKIDEIGPDEFSVARHTYDPLADRPFSDKTLLGGYVKGIHQQTGEIRYRFVPLAKILANRSKAQTLTVWNAHFAEMAQKTLIHVAASRGWFPTPAHVAMALSGMADADHEAAGVILSRAPAMSRAARATAAITASGTSLAGQAARIATQTTSDQPAAETPATGPEKAHASEVQEAKAVCPECGIAIDGYPAEMQAEIVAVGNCPDCPRGAA
jgi:recombinational DNA repair protein RecT